MSDNRRYRLRVPVNLSGTIAVLSHAQHGHAQADEEPLSLISKQTMFHHAFSETQHNTIKKIN